MNPWDKSLAAPVISPPKTQWTNRKGGSVCCWGSLAAGLAIGIVGDAGVGYLRIRKFQVSIRWYKCGLCWNACGFIFDVVLISCVCLFAKKTLTWMQNTIPWLRSWYQYHEPGDCLSAYHFKTSVLQVRANAQQPRLFVGMSLGLWKYCEQICGNWKILKLMILMAVDYSWFFCPWFSNYVWSPEGPTMVAW